MCFRYAIISIIICFYSISVNAQKSFNDRINMLTERNDSLHKALRRFTMTTRMSTIEAENISDNANDFELYSSYACAGMWWSSSTESPHKEACAATYSA